MIITNNELSTIMALIVNNSEKSPVVDADWARTLGQEGLWMAVDGVGTIRNTSSAAQGILQAIGTASLAGKALGSVVPITQLITGPLCVFSAFQHTLPGAIEELKGVAPKDKEGQHVARLGLVNQIFFAKMGAATTACGVVSMMSPAVANLMHFHPILTGPAAVTAGVATNVGLGAIYSIRGGVILARAGYNLHYINEFQNSFVAQGQSIIKNERTLNDAITWLNEQRYDKEGKETASFKRRVGEKCPQNVTSKSSFDEKIEYLAAVDKGIHTKKMQQILSIIIGISMVIGGGLLIASCFFCAPLTLIVLTIIMGVFFATMESVYLHFDSSVLFGKLNDFLYRESPWIQELRKTQHQHKESEEIVFVEKQELINPEPKMDGNLIHVRRKMRLCENQPA